LLYVALFCPQERKSDAKINFQIEKCRGKFDTLSERHNLIWNLFFIVWKWEHNVYRVFRKYKNSESSKTVIGNNEKKIVELSIIFFWTHVWKTINAGKLAIGRAHTFVISHTAAWLASFVIRSCMADVCRLCPVDFAPDVVFHFCHSKNIKILKICKNDYQIRIEHRISHQNHLPVDSKE